MPALSPTMEEGKLAKWLVREGDSVRAGDLIAEIETDTATLEIEAADDGRLGKILVPEGTEHVAVNRPIALLLADGEYVTPSSFRELGESLPDLEKAPAGACCGPAPSWSSSRYARHCVTPWPKRCAATRRCSSWARRSANIRAPTK